MFGETMPIEAVNLLWSFDESRTLSDLRTELRKLAEKRPQEMSMTDEQAKAIGSELAKLFNRDPENVGDVILISAGRIAARLVSQAIGGVDGEGE